MSNRHDTRYYFSLVLLKGTGSDALRLLAEMSHDETVSIEVTNSPGVQLIVKFRTQHEHQHRSATLDFLTALARTESEKYMAALYACEVDEDLAVHGVQNYRRTF